MQILCIGDVVGSHGCDFLRRTLPAFKRTKGIDVVIANGENSSDGNGITPASANHLLDSGVDIITTGNHTYRRILRLYRRKRLRHPPRKLPAGSPG